MSLTTKMAAGSPFPLIEATLIDGSTIDLGKPLGTADWHMLVVYRGKHCPKCTSYLNRLEGFKTSLSEIGISLTAVSGDSRAQLEEHLAELDVSYPIAYGLTEEEMKSLGLYISEPRPQETDHPFAEPGTFIINEDYTLQMADISNAPFLRPELDVLVGGLAYVREHGYPIRGTKSY